MWLCWLTPGIAAGLFLAVYIRWFMRIFSPEPAWYWIVLWTAIALVLLGCAGFSAFIHAGKSGGERFARRVAKFAGWFVLGQMFVAPVMGWMVLYLIFRD